MKIIAKSKKYSTINFIRKDVWYMQELEQLIRKLKILEFKFIFFKLPKKEQLLYLKEYCRKKYDLEEPLSERFYELLLTKVKKDTSSICS